MHPGEKKTILEKQTIHKIGTLCINAMDNKVEKDINIKIWGIKFV